MRINGIEVSEASLKFVGFLLEHEWAEPALVAQPEPKSCLICRRPTTGAVVKVKHTVLHPDCYDEVVETHIV